MTIQIIVFYGFANKKIEKENHITIQVLVRDPSYSTLMKVEA